MMFRWPMMMGFAIHGLFMVGKVSDQSFLSEAAVLIKPRLGNGKSQWAETLSRINNRR
jgi:hypothetical protein